MTLLEYYSFELIDRCNIEKIYEFVKAVTEYREG